MNPATVAEMTTAELDQYQRKLAARAKEWTEGEEWAWLAAMEELNKRAERGEEEP